MKTKTKIKNMLKENTGKSLLDSGDIYGRHYEENQKIDFDKTEKVKLEIYDDEITLTRNIYWVLKETLELNKETKELNKRFQEYVKNAENKNYLGDMEGFCDEVLNAEYRTINTYNHETNLSQTLQYTEFEYKGNRFVLLQIHGGCDVRGGYTEPYIFKDTGLTDFALMNSVTIEVKGKEYTTTDGGYSWKHNNKEINTKELIKLVRNNKYEVY